MINTIRQAKEIVRISCKQYSSDIVLGELGEKLKPWNESLNILMKKVFYLVD